MPARHFEVAERESEPVTFGYRGDIFRCRGEAPALPVLRGMKARLDGGLDEEAQASVILELLDAVFEEGELDRFLRKGASLQALFDVAGKVMSIYNGEDVIEGESLPPGSGATTNSASSSSAST